MIRILLTILCSTMQCRPDRGLGRASVLLAFEGTYRFNGSKSVSEGTNSTVAGWLDLALSSLAAGGAGQP